jgi:DNA topoisomerase-1
MNAQELEQAAEEAGLVYVSDRMPGITRHPDGDGFAYQDPKGRPVTKESELNRIRGLAIPPAYTDVWICPLPNGHLQATGKDARGRKQYRYHARFREVRDEAKFDRMADFCEALPRIHDRVAHDMSLRGLPREKVLAAIVTLLEKSLIRVGNEEYAKENKSYGLTTLRNRHVKVEGSDVQFKFLGKSKVRHDITLHDRRLARVVAKLQELPGQELFQYLDEEGNRHTISSNDVNAYLHEVAGDSFTAKDFRTWAGTVLALAELAAVELPDTKKATKAALTTAIKQVAQQLGNTPTVCRKCYVHPAVVEAFTTGKLREIVGERAEAAEDAVIRLLREAPAVPEMPTPAAPKPKRGRRQPVAA